MPFSIFDICVILIIFSLNQLDINILMNSLSKSPPPPPAHKGAVHLLSIFKVNMFFLVSIICT